MKYRKKPVVIEALELKDNMSIQVQVAKWCSGKLAQDGKIYIETLEGTMTASIGDFIIKGVNGEFYSCKPDIFEMTYEKVD